jgi:hypothetical protein
VRVAPPYVIVAACTSTTRSSRTPTERHCSSPAGACHRSRHRSDASTRRSPSWSGYTASAGRSSASSGARGACLAHPLVDLHAVFADDEEPWRSESLRRYAAAWPANERERILAACRFAEPLACVHQALTYEALAGASEAPDRLWFVAEPPDWIERALESAARL